MRDALVVWAVYARANRALTDNFRFANANGACEVVWVREKLEIFP